MKVVEIHQFNKNHSFFREIDQTAFLSKNLYNVALYLIKNNYIDTQKYLNYHQVQKVLQDRKDLDYYALPTKVSQKILMRVDETYISFFEALKVWKVEPEKFEKKPCPPKYKHKTKGRNILIYNDQAFSKNKKNAGYVIPSGLKIKISTKLSHSQIKEVQIVPAANCYKVCIIYDQEPTVHQLDPSLIASIDLGITNLATVTFNKTHQSLILPGGPAKSINQYYNKERARLQFIFDQENNRKWEQQKISNPALTEKEKSKVRKTSNKLNKLTQKRNNKIADYFHKASTYIVNDLLSKGVSTLVIGYNPGWKSEVNMGKKNNQNFVQLPHRKLIQMLEYKCKLVGITVILQEESYTSKCSFLDLETIEKQEEYVGKRIKRGLFRSSAGKLINADVNGSLNIMRKAISETFVEGIEAVVVQPIRIKPNQTSLWQKCL